MRMDYWHHRQPVPVGVKQELKQFVSGRTVSLLHPLGSSPVSLLKVSSDIFVKAFTLNRTCLYRGDYTAPPSENDYTHAECFLTEDGLAGFAITDSGWLVSVYSNQPWCGFLHMLAPYARCATKLVCIVGGNNDSLVRAYSNTLGFEPIAKTIDDTGIMTEYYGEGFIEDFINHYGHPHHVFMYRSNPNNAGREVLTFEDYFEAEAFVDKEIQ